MKQFENDRFLAAEIMRLIAKHRCQSVIETGTEHAGSANAMAQWVPRVFTCDLAQKFRDGDLAKNILFYRGDSRMAMPVMLSRATQPIFFFLDAHSSNEKDPCPLLDELREISRYKAPDSVIAIHDCVVPGHPELGFDTYRKVPISYDMVRDELDIIYPHGYDYHYNSQAEGGMRGTLFVEPKGKT